MLPARALITFWASAWIAGSIPVRTVSPPTSSCSLVRTRGSSRATQLLYQGAVLLKYLGSAGLRARGALAASLSWAAVMKPCSRILRSTMRRRCSARS